MSTESSSQALTRASNRVYSDIIGIDQGMAAEIIAREFDLDPPNEGQRDCTPASVFSKSVGSQLVADGKKRVSLQDLRLPAHTDG